MNVFMGYNPAVAKQVKVTVWVKEIDGAEPIFPATPNDGDCFIVFDTDDDVLVGNPSSKKSYANGSWGDVGGGGGADIPVVTLTMTSDEGGTYTSTVPFEQMYTMANNYVNASLPLVLPVGDATNYMALATADNSEGVRLLITTVDNSKLRLAEDGTVTEQPR